MSKFFLCVYIGLTLALVLLGGLKLFNKDPFDLGAERLAGLTLLYLTSMGTIVLIREYRSTTTTTAINQAFAAYLGPYVQEAHVLATTHEKDFYTTWGRQVREARVAVDITNLTAKPPANATTQESTYFKDFGQMIGATKAIVRRVERITTHKIEYVTELINKMKDKKHCSLALYVDPIDTDDSKEMTLAVSMQRIDNKFAWIVALAEHNAVSKPVRDIMLTGKDSAELVGAYFDRLWSHSRCVVLHGKVQQAEWDKIRNEKRQSNA